MFNSLKLKKHELNQVKISIDFEYISLFFVLIWDSLRYLHIFIDGALRIPFFISLIFTISHLKYLLQRKFIAWWLWLLWVLYSLVNVYIQGYNHFAFPNFFFQVIITVLPLSTMAMIIWLWSIDKQKVVFVSFIGMIFKCFAMLPADMFSNLSFHTRLVFEHNEIASNSNEVGIYCCIMMLLACLWYSVRKSTNMVVIIVCCAISGFLVMKTGSRTAFILYALILILFVFSNMTNMKNILLFSIFIIGALIFCFPYLQNAVVFKRLGDTQYEIAGSGYARFVPDNLWVRLLGDRSVYYYIGAHIFMQFPLFGVGLNNFILYNEFGYICHVDIMSQFAEEGIIGTFIYFLFWGVLIKILFQDKGAKESFQNNIMYVSCLVLPFIAIFVSSFSQRIPYYVLLGIYLAWATDIKQDARKYEIWQS